MKRILTAAVLAPLITYVVLAGADWLVWTVITAVAVLCFREYCSIATAYGLAKPGPPGYVAGLLVLLLPRADVLMVTLIGLLTLTLMFRSRDLAKALPEVGAFLFGLIYVFGPWRSAIGLHAASPHWLFLVLAMNWIGDSAAYLVGRKWGRRKLAPRLSPGKTWEGGAASLAVSVAFGFFYLGWAIPDIAPGLSLAIVAAANVAGQVGDLAESLIKRGAGIKDSGSMLPGHGGWLDRVDGTLFTLPLVHFLVIALGRA